MTGVDLRLMANAAIIGNSSRSCHAIGHYPALPAAGMQQRRRHLVGEPPTGPQYRHCDSGHKQAGRKRQPTAMRLGGEGSASEEPYPGGKFLRGECRL